MLMLFQMTASLCVTLCVSLIVSLSHWFNLACQHFSHRTSCRRGEMRPGERGNTSRRKEQFRMVPSSTVVTWRLNPSHIWNPAALNWRSQIPSAGASPFEFVIPEESGNVCGELMESVCVCVCVCVCVSVSLASPERTHTYVFVQHTSAGRHATWYASYSHNSHCWHTRCYLWKSHVQKAKRDDCIHVPHTDSLTDFGLGS